MTWRVIVGTLALVATMVVMGFVLLTEPTRMASFDRAYFSRRIETGAALFESNCASCHGPQGKGIEGVAPSLNAADLFNGERLQAIGWTGTVEDYVQLTIAAGRPKPTEGTSYPNRMPTWSQEYGGPLRTDQVEALVAYVMNWEDTALAEGQGTPTGPTEAVGADITRELPPGNAEAGKALSESLGCTACHITATVGPAWLPAADQPGIGARAETRFAEPDYTGQATTAGQYLFESIVLPDAHVVDGFAPGVMPKIYSERLSPQDAADIIAYLESLE